MTTPLRFQRIRAGWYETADNEEGAYVISSEEPGSWIIYRWTLVEWHGGSTLERVLVESAGTLAYAKELAAFDASLGEIAR